MANIYKNQIKIIIKKGIQMGFHTTGNFQLIDIEIINDNKEIRINWIIRKTNKSINKPNYQ